MHNHVFIQYTRGCCWRRVLDAEALKVYFRKNNDEIVSKPELADIIILVTCAFIKKTEDISINEIQANQKYKGKLIVTGCIPGINQKRLLEYFQGDNFPVSQIDKINDYFPENNCTFEFFNDSNDLMKQKNHGNVGVPVVTFIKYLLSHARLDPIFYINCSHNLFSILRSRFSFFTKISYLRISWGCDERCSYCVEWMAVGKYKSKPFNLCCEEFDASLSKNIKRFAIIGDNPAAYGMDLNMKFSDLLAELFRKDKDIEIMTIDGVNPKRLYDDLDGFCKVLKNNPGKIKFIMIPVQSGNNRILRLMERGYTKEELREIVNSCHEADHTIKLITQIIAGFPSETEEEFMESVDLMKELKFVNVVMFPYFKNPQTKSASIGNDVPEPEMLHRIAKAKKSLGDAGIFYFHLDLDLHNGK